MFRQNLYSMVLMMRFFYNFLGAFFNNYGCKGVKIVPFMAFKDMAIKTTTFMYFSESCKL
jgi:hypothetical protein